MERISIFKYFEFGRSNKKRVWMTSAAPSLPFSPLFSSPTIALCASFSFNHKGATGNFLMSLYCRRTVPPTLSRSCGEDSSPAGNHHPNLGGGGMEHMLPQINHCDQSHGCTANHRSKRLWKSRRVPDVPSNDYVVSGAKGNWRTSRKREQWGCQFSTLIKHTLIT